MLVRGRFENFACRSISCNNVIKRIEKKFGKITVKQGKSHTFMRMNIEFTKKRIVTIFMKDYIKECKEAYKEAGGKISGRSNILATDTLFWIDDTSKQLNNNRSEVFYYIVSKLLYMSKWARIDIDLAISFLCTRVSKSTEQD